MGPSMHTSGAIAAETEEVLGWVEGLLPGRGRGLRVLEVGCGPGYLAAQLLERGAAVTAIDVSEEQVLLARERGVPAIVSDFLSYDGGRFDALLFTRSLHHIHPLEEAIRKIRGLLEPGGLLLADEFAHDAMTAATAAWFWDLQTVLEESGALAPDVPRHHQGGPSGHAPHPASAILDPLERWRERHVHEPPLHGAKTVLSAVGAAFEITSHQRGPYLHRYFSDRVEDTERGTRIFARVRELETLRIAQRLLVPIGFRVTAVRRG
jgi:SAM-dependent methyltransferase